MVINNNSNKNKNNSKNKNKSNKRMKRIAIALELISMLLETIMLSIKFRNVKMMFNKHNHNIMINNNKDCS